MNGGSSNGEESAPGECDGVRVITSYADARAILVHAAALVPADVPPPGAGGSAADALVERGAYLRSLWMWGCHTDRRAACRKVAAAALGPGPVELLIPYLEAQAAALLDSAVEADEFDLVVGYARPLVRDALMEMFGIDPAARAALQAQVGVMEGFIPGNGSGGTARYFALAATAKRLEGAWSKPLPPRAAASLKLRGAVEAGEVSIDEALAQATLLLFGNSYTTLDALTGLLVRLAEDPQLWHAARGGSPSAATLVEESIRLGPPEHLVLFREAAGEIECPGGIIPKGARIALPLDRLNRDPACFERSSAFEPQRSGAPHLGFGAGRHMCVGLHLARAVIRIAVESLFVRMPAWPAEMRIGRTTGILGGSSVASLTVPAGAIRPC